MNEPMIITVTVDYKGMSSAIKIDLSELNNDKYYLEVIKDHVNIAKQIIDRKTLKK